MKEILEILNKQVGNYVIVGSLALYLQGMIEDFNGKDIDIIVDKDEDYFSDNPYWKPQHNRFSDKRGWVTQLNNTWIEVFNNPFPEYDEFDVDGVTVKVITIKEIKEHYKNLDINKIGGHQNFQNKLRAYIEMSS